MCFFELLLPFQYLNDRAIRDILVCTSNYRKKADMENQGGQA